MRIAIAIVLSLPLVFIRASWNAVVAETDSPSSHVTDREQLIEKLKCSGVRVESDENEPKRLAVVLVGDLASDAILADVGKLEKITALAVCGQGITDESLKHLKTLSQLRRLDLRYTRITDAGLAHISGMTDLRKLRLDGSFRITDAGLRRIKLLDKLESLDLTLTKTTDQGIADLQQALPKVKIFKRYHAFDAAGVENGPQRHGTTIPTPGRLDRLMREVLPRNPEANGMVPDWTLLAVALDEILNASPENIRAWSRHVWNLGYNAATDCEDIQERYWWKKQGVLVSIAGAKHNPSSGAMLFSVIWLTGWGIGSPDDAEQFRRLFADDTELHTPLLSGIRRKDVLGPNGKPDNWLVARQWSLRAQPLQEKEYASDPENARSPLIFYSSSAMCQIKHAISIEQEGVFGEAAAKAWAEAERQWNAYGDRNIPMGRDRVVCFNKLDELKKEAKRLRKELNRMIAADSNQDKALAVAADIQKLNKQIAHTRRAIDLVNFDYWKSRCRMEQLPSTVDGRRLLHEARRELQMGQQDSNDPGRPGAKQLFEQGFLAWQRSLANFPIIETDQYDVGPYLAEALNLYRKRILDGGPFPAKFPLKHLAKQSNDTDKSAE